MKRHKELIKRHKELIKRHLDIFKVSSVGICLLVTLVQYTSFTNRYLHIGMVENLQNENIPAVQMEADIQKTLPGPLNSALPIYVSPIISEPVPQPLPIQSYMMEQSSNSDGGWLYPDKSKSPDKSLKRAPSDSPVVRYVTGIITEANELTLPVQKFINSYSFYKSAPNLTSWPGVLIRPIVNAASVRVNMRLQF